MSGHVYSVPAAVVFRRWAAHADPAAPSDELLNCNAELSHLYVQAIRSKLDLFESLTGGA